MRVASVQESKWKKRTSEDLRLALDMESFQQIDALLNSERGCWALKAMLHDTSPGRRQPSWKSIPSCLSALREKQKIN